MWYQGSWFDADWLQGEWFTESTAAPATEWIAQYSRIDTPLEPKKRPKPVRMPRRQTRPDRQREPAVASLEIWPGVKAVAKYTRRVYDPYLDERFLQRRQRDDVKRYWRVA